MENEYLREAVGFPLEQCLAQIVEIKPQDPIEWIAQWLYRYTDNEIFFHEKTIYLKDVAQLHHELEMEKEKRHARIQDLKKDIKCTKADMKDKFRLKAILDMRTDANRISRQSSDSSKSGPVRCNNRTTIISVDGEEEGTLRGNEEDEMDKVVEAEQGVKHTVIVPKSKKVVTHKKRPYHAGNRARQLSFSSNSFTSMLLKPFIPGEALLRDSQTYAKNRESLIQWMENLFSPFHDTDTDTDTDSASSDSSHDFTTRQHAKHTEHKKHKKRIVHDTHSLYKKLRGFKEFDQYQFILTDNAYTEITETLKRFTLELPEFVDKDYLTGHQRELYALTDILVPMGSSSWRLDSRWGLICQHSILGKLTRRSLIVPKETPDWWERQGYLEQNMYDHEIYSTDLHDEVKDRGSKGHHKSRRSRPWSFGFEKHDKRQ